MNKHYQDDGLTLHTDLYQINMAEIWLKAYFRDGIHNRRAVFDLYFRKLPFSNGYAIFAGLEKIVQYIENFRFSETDIAYLRDELPVCGRFYPISTRIKVHGYNPLYEGRGSRL